MAYDSHHRILEQVLQGLRTIGYADGLLALDYEFSDWFSDTPVNRVASAAAFGRQPASYDSACFVVTCANGTEGVSLINSFRSVGAPLAFEVKDRSVSLWKVGPDLQTTVKVDEFEDGKILKAFRNNREQWCSQSILRAKNVTTRVSKIAQLDFVDFGLIPAIESEMAEKLDCHIGEAFSAAEKQYAQAGLDVDWRAVFAVGFRLLAGKILHDRGVVEFKKLTETTAAEEILAKVSKYYRENFVNPLPAAVIAALKDCIWRPVNLSNVSVEVLAYIYENTLISPEQRKQLGTHSTPYQIARYMVARLSFEKVPEDERRVLEPCSGHGIFLVAALQRLRELSDEADPRKRHDYLVRMLRGFEYDAFAREVSRLCLMIADFPNPNGWKLAVANVFDSAEFTAEIKRARFILCNPPFEEFSPEDREKYSLAHVSQPGELFHRLLEDAPHEACIAFVLPQAFIFGSNFKAIRRKLAERFSRIHAVELPDRMFTHSVIESSIIICTEPRTEGDTKVRVEFARVSDGGRGAFLADYSVDYRDYAELDIEQASESFRIPRLGTVWKSLVGGTTFQEVAELHRGLEWKPPFDEGLYISNRPKEGFAPGYHVARKNSPFKTPQLKHLSTVQETRRRHAFDLDWSRKKVFINSVRASRGPWRLTAFAEHRDRKASTNFTAAFMPPDSEWTPEVLAAVINSRVANAFVAVNCPGKHNLLNVLRRLPLPQLAKLDVAAITECVEVMEEEGEGSQDFCKALEKVNNLVERGYQLSAVATGLLDEFFSNATRPVENHKSAITSDKLTGFNAWDLFQKMIDSGVHVPHATEAISYVEEFPGVMEVLDKMVKTTRRHFPTDAQITVEVFNDPDCSDRTLSIIVRKKEYAPEFFGILERIATKYGPSLTTLPGDSWITVATDFASPDPKCISTGKIS